MTVNIIEEAISAKDTKTLLNFLSRITEGLHQITQFETQVRPSNVSQSVDSDLKKSVTALALQYMKKNGAEGKKKFLSDILVPALGVHKTFADCTNEDFKAIEAKLLEEKGDA